MVIASVDMYFGCLQCAGAVYIFSLRPTVVDCGSQDVADIFGNFWVFMKNSPNIKFPENLQPCLCCVKDFATVMT